MSYRLITIAKFTVTSATGVTTEREVQVRAYPSPKRDAAGAITVDGDSTTFKRTGGKGRGTADNRYMYATVKSESAFWAITEAEATGAVGGQIALTSVVKVAEPVAEPVAEAQEAPIPSLTKAERRAAAKVQQAA